MKITRHNKMCATVRATLDQMKTVAAAPSQFRLDRNEQSLFTYAKAYYRHGGWWWVRGYDYDGTDVTRVLDRLNKLNEV